MRASIIVFDPSSIEFVDVTALVNTRSDRWHLFHIHFQANTKRDGEKEYVNVCVFVWERERHKQAYTHTQTYKTCKHVFEQRQTAFVLFMLEYFLLYRQQTQRRHRTTTQAQKQRAAISMDMAHTAVKTSAGQAGGPPAPVRTMVWGRLGNSPHHKTGVGQAREQSTPQNNGVGQAREQSTPQNWCGAG